MRCDEINDKKIVITRPEKSANDFIDFMCADGMFKSSDFLISSVLDIRQCPVELSQYDFCDSVIITSAHAVRVLEDCDSVWHEKDYYVVGSSVEKKLREIGCDNIMCVSPCVSGLMNVIKQVCISAEQLNFCYLRGVHISVDIVPTIEKMEHNVVETIVYDACAIENISQDVIDAFGNNKVDAVAFFSKRSAEVFLKSAHNAELFNTLHTIKALCISDDVLKCLHTVFSVESAVAPYPNRNGMHALIKENTRLLRAQRK